MKNGLYLLWILSIAFAFFLGYKVKSIPTTKNFPIVIQQRKVDIKTNHSTVNTATPISDVANKPKITNPTKKPMVIKDIITELKYQLGNNQTAMADLRVISCVRGSLLRHPTIRLRGVHVKSRFPRPF